MGAPGIGAWGRVLGPLGEEKKTRRGETLVHWRMPVSDTLRLASPITLSALRRIGGEIVAIRDEIEESIEGPVYFPFIGAADTLDAGRPPTCRRCRATSSLSCPRGSVSSSRSEVATLDWRACPATPSGRRPSTRRRSSIRAVPSRSPSSSRTSKSQPSSAVPTSQATRPSTTPSKRRRRRRSRTTTSIALSSAAPASAAKPSSTSRSSTRATARTVSR